MSDEKGWDEFNERWNRLLRKHGFHYIHMTQFYSQCRQKDWDKAKSDSVLTDFIEAIRESALIQFSTGLDGRYLRHKFSLIGKRKVDPALFAVQRVLKQMRNASKRWTDGSLVPLLLNFDEEYGYSIETYKIISRLRLIRPELTKLIASITFADDKLFSPLQAADILANLTNAYWREQISSGKEPVEPDPLLKLLVSEPEHAGLIIGPSELWDKQEIDKHWEQLRKTAF
jgi:hypothetical protein